MCIKYVHLTDILVIAPGRSPVINKSYITITISEINKRIDYNSCKNENIYENISIREVT